MAEGTRVTYEGPTPAGGVSSEVRVRHSKRTYRLRQGVTETVPAGVAKAVQKLHGHRFKVEQPTEQKGDS
jgi:hypothetical protein